MGTPHRVAPAVHLSPPGSEPACGGGKAEHQGTSRGVTVENWTGPCQRDDLSAGAASEAVKAAGSGAGCGTGGGRFTGIDCGELGGGIILKNDHTVKQKSRFRSSGSAPI